MDKPFVFGVPVEDSHFIGREGEIKRLATNFKYGVNTVLISPRRWGKTSLVNKVAGLVASKKLVVVKMDIFSCRNEYDFFNVFSEAILKPFHAGRKAYLRRAGPTVVRDRGVPRFLCPAIGLLHLAFNQGKGDP